MVEEDDTERAERPTKRRMGKAKPLEVELDLGCKFSRKSMLMSSLENEKEEHFGGFGQV